MSKFAESHDISYIKDLRISTLFKKVYSWFSDKWKFDIFLRFLKQRLWLFKNVQRLLKLGKYNYSKVSMNKNICQIIRLEYKPTNQYWAKWGDPWKTWNLEKRSQYQENLHKAIYVNFHKKKLLSPSQGLFKWNFIFWITPKIYHLKRTLVSLLLDTTKSPHSCLLLWNLKKWISP